MSTYTVYAAAATTLQEVTTKESVDDLIVNLFPLDTPLQQMLGREPMTAVFREQPIDTFGSSFINRVATMFTSATTHAKTESSTVSSYAAQYPGRLISCVAELQHLAFDVSETDQISDKYGISDRFAYEALKATEAVVNNFEHSFHWSPGSPPGGRNIDGAGNWARQTQGLAHWMTRTGLQRSIYGIPTMTTDAHGNNMATGTTLNTAATTWCYNAGGLALDQAMFKQNIMAPWYQLTGRQGGAVGLCGGTVKNLFSQFGLSVAGQINERSITAAAKMIVDTVDWYETDYGLVSLNLDRYLDISGETTTVALDGGTVVVPWNETLIFLKPEYFKIGVFQPVSMSPLAKVGTFDRGFVRGQLGLLCKNPQACSGAVNVVP